ncbi:hypothetical protein PVAND_010629 [Polypedilum vanderplanki]|uniref:Dynein axonemal assembly factor 1 homolog n=1 Tax=Polypedilum vanderplanki TaxID=319348 RepID=A0A9J6CHC9_POLVA|nr:hypothetical protein PVAND_010629 [Polypedilum vanderplanki]
MDELDHRKIFNKIIFKELEPSVLNEEVIRNAVYEQGPAGEAGRLFRQMEIQYEKVTVLRLEFLNILKIDHLWILPNLSILSLAFNKIDKIENLDSLTALKELNLAYNSIEKLGNLDKLRNLEIFNVFGNKIRKIENVDCLENLIIFSAGNNLIDTKDGLERLRFLKKLRSLNLKGNEIEKNDKHFRLYIAGLLPDLTYYEYRHINKLEREEGKDRFRFKLREIVDNEKFEVQERERIKQATADRIHHTACFVEDFDDDQLFQSLFVFTNDGQGQCLLEIGEEANNLRDEFRYQTYAVTQTIFKIGLDEYEKRTNEEKVFRHCVAVGKKEVQVLGQNIANEFLERSENIFITLKKIYDDYYNGSLKDADTSLIAQQVKELSEEFQKLYDTTWKSLMENEMHMHECVVEAISTFENIIQDIMNVFIEKCKTQFVLLRELEGNFIDGLIEAVQTFVTTKASFGMEDQIPSELRESLLDREIINGYAIGMREMHLSKIDGREDTLILRGKKWVADLCEKLMKDEIDRNRQKVMEINYFLDIKQSKFDELTSELYFDKDVDTVDTPTTATIETHQDDMLAATTN